MPLVPLSSHRVLLEPAGRRTRRRHDHDHNPAGTMPSVPMPRLRVRRPRAISPHPQAGQGGIETETVASCLVQLFASPLPRIRTGSAAIEGEASEEPALYDPCRL